MADQRRQAAASGVEDDDEVDDAETGGWRAGDGNGSPRRDDGDDRPATAAPTTSDGYGLWRPGRGAVEGWRRRQQRQATARRRRGFGRAGNMREGSSGELFEGTGRWNRGRGGGFGVGVGAVFNFVT
ncbi:hypothetical protein E2562_017959 [Oryza meyeriana var. granulata]|uniref:Uncharacterized protein n=1 Tax=Oryza meyeriana var. granulata TaxID=110450 RepID=A0A6G1F8U6_9ORYZ|nr:hypothetical protein E2562_017959 [Oryza meyeriana var. granulata]